MTHSDRSANTRDTEEALIAYMERKLLSTVNAAVIHNDLGIMFYRKGDNRNAHKHLEAAMALEPDNCVYLKNMADFLFTVMKCSQGALKLYRKILTLDPADVNALTILANILLSEKQYAEAGTCFRRILDMDPGNVEVRTHLAYVDRQMNLSRDDGSIDPAQSLYDHIQSLIRQGDEKSACEQLEKLIRSYPRFALAYNDLGVLYYQSGDRQKSLEAYEQAVKLEPGNITFKKNLADYKCIELNQVQQAMILYNEVLAEEPDDPETLLAMGQACAMIGQKQDARHFLKQARP